MVLVNVKVKKCSIKIASDNVMDLQQMISVVDVVEVEFLKVNVIVIIIN